ncbi:MAG TPA: anaerobic ribonucleoside-triphosphate reductase activating protein [Candidatus Aenigmarchaeota archaeon]|nr:anaerobic ribonucleoside-triphosphate reductase activating protein [Candidatus Aenigmarchaeota archaeon]
MIIGGFQKFSLIDYPEKISAIVFTQGCNFRCPYCHNPELVLPEKYSNPIPEEEILSFLDSRRGKLDAVVITGGEPLLQKDLFDFIKKVKDMGFLVKLDTNGSMPEVLKEAIKLGVDYIAMDVKAPLEKYREVVRAEVNEEKIKSSIEIIMHAGIEYEFRTTVVKSLLSKEDILKIGMLINGARLYVLQKFIPSKLVDPKFMKEETYSDEEFEEMKEELKRYVKECIIR